jgi:hypothetical protein
VQKLTKTFAKSREYGIADYDPSTQQTCHSDMTSSHECLRYEVPSYSENLATLVVITRLLVV